MKIYHSDKKNMKFMLFRFLNYICFELLDIFNTLISWQHGELAIYILL